MSVLVRLFGTLEIVGPGGRLRADEFPSRKAKQVVAVLGLASGEPVSKERLVDQVWGERLPIDPIGTVEQAVSVLRRALRTISDDPVVVTRSGRYQLDPDVVTVDVDEFDRRIADAATSDAAAREAALTAALAIATGELLEDEPVTAWVEVARERRRSTVERTWVAVAELALARGDAAAAVAAAERARSLSPMPFDEAYRTEVDALLALGEPHRAAQVLDELELRLLDQRRTPRIDLDSMRLAVGASTRRSRRTRAEVTTALADPPRELGFSGRGRVVDAIAAHWANRTAATVVLVEAPAGMGRTRLLAHVGSLAGEQRTVIEVGCNPGDRAQPLLVAGRLLRAAARAGGAKRVPAIDDVVPAMFGRLADVLERIDAPVLLVDDVHRADPATLALLAALTASDAGVPMTVVATCRRALADDVAYEFAGGAIERVALTSLQPADLDAIDLSAAWDETGGHPGTLAACWSAARRDRVLDPAEVDAVLARVDESSVEVGAIVDVIATAGASTIDALVALTRRSPNAVRWAVADAVGSELVTIGDDGGVVLTADILRRVVVARING